MHLALRVCPMCAAGAVRAVLLDEVGLDELRISVQCGQCGVWRRTTASEADVDRYERVVRRDRRRMGTQARRLAARRMRRSRDEFLRVLRGEIVGPEDFLARARRSAPSVQRRHGA